MRISPRNLGRTLFLLAVALVTAAVLFLRTEYAGEKACALAREKLPGLTGLDVSIARCGLDPVRGGVELIGVSLSEKGAAEPLFAVDRLLVRVRTFDVVTGRIRVERVELDKPRVNLDLEKLLKDDGKKDEKKPSKKSCPLDRLSGLELDSLTISDAAIKLKAPGSRGVQVDDLDVDLAYGRTYSVRVNASRGKLDTGPLDLPLSRLKVAAALDVGAQRLSVQRVDIAAGELSVFARGDIQSLCDPNPSLDVAVNAPLDVVEAIIGPGAPRMSGNVAVEMNVEGRLTEPLARANVTLAHVGIDRFDIGDAVVEAHYEKKKVTVDRLDVEVGQGHVTAGNVTIGMEPPFPLEGSVNLTDIEFGRMTSKFGLTHAWVNFVVPHGHVESKGTLMPLKLNGPAVLDIRDFHVWDRPWDSHGQKEMLAVEKARIELQAEFTPDREKLSHIHLKTEKSDLLVDVALHPDEKKGIDLTGDIKAIDLSELKHVAGIPWDGVLSGRATVKGPYSEMKIGADVTAQNFKFHKLDLGSLSTKVTFINNVLAFEGVSGQRGRSGYQAEGSINFGAKDSHATGKLTLNEARLADLLAMVGDELWIFDLMRAGKADAKLSGEAAVEGPLMAPTATIDLSMADATYYDRKLGSGEVFLGIDEGRSMTIDKLGFDGPCGRLSFTGHMDFDGEMDFALDAPTLSVPNLALPEGEWMKLAGTMNGHARLFGPGDHAKMEGTLNVSGLATDGITLGDGPLALRMDGKRLSLSGPLGHDFLVDMRLDTAGDMPFAVGVAAQTQDLGHYLPRFEGLKGALKGDLFATGTIRDYQNAEGNIALSGLSLGKGDYLASSDGPVEIAFRGKAVELRTLTLKGTQGTKMTATGFLDEKGGVDFGVDGSFDVRLVESFVPWVDQTAGKMQVSASLAGTLDQVTVIGSAELENGKFGWRGYPVVAKGLTGRMEFSQNKVYLTEMRGTLNNGPADIRGEVELKQFLPHRLNLTLTMDESQFRIPDWLPTTVSGAVDITGPLENLKIGGTVDLVKARYTQDQDVEKFLNDLKRRRVEARNFEKRDEFMRFDVNVHVLPNAKVDDNLVRMNLEGDLKVVGTNARWGMLGTLHGVEGAKAFFRGNEFNLTRVSIDLVDRERIAAVVDIHGETQVRDYKVNVHATGPMESPEVHFHSEPELADADVVTLLTLGFTSRESGNATAAGASLVGETLFNISGLDKQVKRFLPQNNTVLRDFNLHMSTAYSEASGQVEPTAQIESRFLTDALKLRLSQPVVSGKGRRAQAEYQVNDHMSAQAQWDNATSGYPFGDLGLDLKLRWELN